MRIRPLVGWIALVGCGGGDPNVFTEESQAVVSARLRDPSGEIASIVWDRATGDATWSVGAQAGSIHLERLNPDSAVTALRELVRIRSKAPTAPKSGYVTCGDANYCEAFDLDGGGCFACVEVRGDCSSTLTWTCTFYQ